MKKPDAGKEKDVIKVTSVNVTRVKNFDGFVVFDMQLNGIIIYGCRVIETEKGDFIAFPSKKGKDGNYYNICYARIGKEEQAAILKTVESML